MSQLTKIQFMGDTSPAVCPPLSDPIIERKCFILEQLHSLDIKRCKWALIYLAIKVQCGSFILYFWWLWPLSPASCWFLCFLFLLQKAPPPPLGPRYSNSLHLSHISASLNPPQSKGRTMVLSLLIILTNENECINFRYDTAVLCCCIFINSWASYLTLSLFIFFSHLLRCATQESSHSPPHPLFTSSYILHSPVGNIHF